jgi:uncharacterized membrane protein YbjE (DUF340 family)
MKVKDNRFVIGISVLSLVALIAYDWWAAARAKSTASKLITTSAQKHLIIPFLWGFITGHLFWSQKKLGDSNDSR